MGLAISEGLIRSTARYFYQLFDINDSHFVKIGQNWEQKIGWGKSNKDLDIEGHFNFSNFNTASRYIILRTSIDAPLDQFRYGYYNANGESYVYLEAVKSFLLTKKGLSFKYLCKSDEIVEKRRKKEMLLIEDANSTYLRIDFSGCKQEEFLALLSSIISLCNPILEDWQSQQDVAVEMITSNSQKDAKPVEQDLSLAFDPAVPICKIPYVSLTIPNYQRTYKWERRQINQLINDILGFQIEYESDQNAKYHIGTLVLHLNDKKSLDIVDGQQRMVSLSLIFYFLLKDRDTRAYAETNYPEFFSSIAGFLNRTEYDNSIAIQNLSKNFDAIRERGSDLNKEFFITLMQKCQIAIVRLKDQAQAFQFFDSQNSRGKDLEPHDLLKAFHLREVSSEDEQSEKYEADISEWQNIKTLDLVELFVCLYRIKTWAKGNSAKYFTKDDTSEFKGLSLKKYSGRKEKKEEQFPSYAATFFLSKFLKEKEYDKCREFFAEKKNALIEDHTIDYPFQIDGNVINGLGFFDFALYYNALFKKVKRKDTFESGPLCCKEAADILDLLSSYTGRWRTGDGYVRDAFNALLLYYIDKFGTFQLGKAVEKIFVWCYHIRLHHSSVFLATVDKECRSECSLFKVLRDAMTPFDFLNSYVELDTMNEDYGKELYAKFDDLGKIKRQ